VFSQGCAVLEKAVECAAELAIIAHFGYVHECGDAGFFCVRSCGVRGIFVPASFREAFLTPLVDRHLLDEEVFDGALRLQLVAKSLEERGGRVPGADRNLAIFQRCAVRELAVHLYSETLRTHRP
jgi:hypothetical protein